MSLHIRQPVLLTHSGAIDVLLKLAAHLPCAAPLMPQSNTITLERDFNFMLPDGQVLPRGMGQNSLGGNTYVANPRACLYTCVNSRDP